MVREATEVVPPRRAIPTLREFSGFKAISIGADAGNVGVGFFGPFPVGLSVDFIDCVITAAAVAIVSLHIGVFSVVVSRTVFLTSVDGHLIGGETTGEPSMGFQFSGVTTAGSQVSQFRVNLFHRVETGFPFIGVRLTSAGEDIESLFSLGVG